MRTLHMLLVVAAAGVMIGSVESALGTPTPLWEFKFDDVSSGNICVNTGSDPNAANAYLTMQTTTTRVPTNRRILGGPSGLATDYCWNGAPGYFAQVPGSEVGGISNLNQVTCTGWYEATQPVPITPQYNRVFLWGNRHNWDQGMVVDFNPQNLGYNQLGFEVNDYYNRDEDGGGDGYAGPVVNDVGVWHFWAITYDGTQTSNNVKIYMGSTSASVLLIGTASITYMPLDGGTPNNPTGIIRNAGGNFNLAGNEDWNYSGGFVGCQDDIRIFDGVLSLGDMESVRQGDVMPVPYLAGDVNRDRKVSFYDYLLLESNFGKTNATWDMGDFNNDGKVSFADYLMLEANFGKSIPEPATIILVCAGLLAVRKRSRIL